MSEQHKASSSRDPALEIARSILTEAAQRPWLAALLMRRRPAWLTRLLQLAQWVRNLPHHTRRVLRRKLAYGLAAATLLLALAGTPTVYAGTITVDSGAAGVVIDGKCSLAEAIINANDDAALSPDCAAGSGADTITLPVSDTLSYATALGFNAALPNITSPITIEGRGSTIRRAGAGTDFRILNIQYYDVNVTLNQVTISGGNVTSFGGNGGGIANYRAGTLTVTNSTISGNTAGAGAGGIANYGGGTLIVLNSTVSGNTANHGGGIFSNGTGTLTVQNSTISGNTATSNDGGGIDNGSGTLAVQNSTIVSNTATASNGGGINNGGGGTLTVQNSTIVSNTTANHGGGIFNSGIETVENSTLSGNTATFGGGGIADIGGVTSVQNSIVAGQTSGDDCYNAGVISSSGYNIESGTSCGFDPSIVTGDQWNVDNSSLKLLPLANNGGPTWTQALGNGSVAIEKIPAASCGTPTDQRGYARPGNRNQPTNKCEIGAWEAQLADPTAITLRDLTATANTSSGVIGAAFAALAALGALLIGRRRLKIR